jgi:hypothetical protein
MWGCAGEVTQLDAKNYEHSAIALEEKLLLIGLNLRGKPKKVLTWFLYK